MPFVEIIHEDVFGVGKSCGGGFSELSYVEGFGVFG